MPSPVRAPAGLRCVPTDLASLRAGLAEALDGGPPLAPLPDEPGERERALATLRPELPVAEPDAAVVLATSGSTGRPKGVVLSRSALHAAADAVHRRLGGPGDWVLALPGHYVAGLQVVARAIVARTAVHPVRGDLADLATAISRMSGRRYVSLVPTQLHRACAIPAQAEALARCAAVLVGGAATEPGLLDRARALGIPVVTTYGMSETGGGCVYDGAPLDGVTVAVDGDGRIRLGGPTLFSGYRLDPERTASALRDGWFRTEDRGRWDADRLVVEGRLDTVVDIGGHSVDLDRVERLVRERLGEAAVVAVPDPEWGARIVVAAADGDLGNLQAWLARSLPPHALPRSFLRTALPRTAGGKVDRERLRRLGAAG